MTGFSRRFGENSAVLADPPLHRLASSPRAAPEAAARLEKEDSSVGQAHMAPRPTSRRPALHLESCTIMDEIPLNSSLDSQGSTTSLTETPRMRTVCFDVKRAFFDPFRYFRSPINLAPRPN